MNSTAKKVLGFLVAKGLLVGDFPANGSVKLTVKDFLRTAEDVEPRVLAVLPAALIHFPKAFSDRNRLPKELSLVIDAIIRDADRGPNLFHVPFTELKRWANSTLKDKRTKPVKERKSRKTYRFSPEVVAKVEKISAQRNLTETAFLENLVRKCPE